MGATCAIKGCDRSFGEETPHKYVLIVSREDMDKFKGIDDSILVEEARDMEEGFVICIVCEALLNQCGTKVSFEIERDSFNDEAWEMYKRDEITKDEFLERNEQHI